MGCGHDFAGSTPSNLQADAWTHLCYTYDGTSVRAYQNNVLKETHALGLDVEPVQSGGVAIIGSHVSGAYSLNGDIDEVTSPPPTPPLLTPAVTCRPTPRLTCRRCTSSRETPRARL